MRFLTRWLPLLKFRGSRAYWERRYQLGGDSGEGSYGAPARYKAAVLNTFVAQQGVASVIEFGCGDGHQLTLAEYPEYLGVDVSRAAIDRCKQWFVDNPNRRFVLLDDYTGDRAQLALSLDVLFHLVEDAVYEAYLARLFGASERFVAVYATSVAEPVRTLPHVRHRPVENDIKRQFPNFRRMADVESALPPPVHSGEGGSTRFFFYQRIDGG